MFEWLPVERAARWDLMRSILSQWMRPLAEADALGPEQFERAEERLGCRLPEALREWYQLAGAARDIWCSQDQLLSPERLALWDDILVFCVENQTIWAMGMQVGDLDQPDPPVVGWMNTHGPEMGEFGPLNDSLSECALQYLAWAMKWANWNPHFACRLASNFSGAADFGWCKPATLAAIEQHYLRCAFPVWRLMGRDTVFYEGEDLVLEVGHANPEEGNSHVDASPRTIEALATFEHLVRGTGFR
jgi:hypothetical protein